MIEKHEIKGIAHITGGGFIENIPRIIPQGMGIDIDLNSSPLPKVFKALGEIAGIGDDKMYNTFNMGIGLVMAVSPEFANEVVATLKDLGEEAYIIGSVTDKSGVNLHR